MATPFCTLLIEGHDAITAILVVGVATLLVIIAHWSGDCRKRLQEHTSVVRRPSNYLIPTGRDEAFLTPENLTALPSVAFIMPVKWNSIKTVCPVGTWRSQVLTAYQGKHECIFVVESEDDGAVSVLQALQDELKEHATKMRIVVAGPSTTCTQKIHNMVAGVDAASADMEYVFFMDANSHMHPGTVTIMVAEMVDDAKIFATSGFPLDIPTPGASVWAWAMCQYRYFCLSSFSHHRATFPWGGAMLMRKREIDNDACEIKTRWINGGYSDDLLVGAAALDHGRTICTPLRALFPNPMKPGVSFRQAWDFIRRQAFTMTTFSSGRHCRVVSALLFGYAFFKGLLVPALLVSICVMSSFPLCAVHARTLDHLWSYDLALSMLFVLSFWYSLELQRRYLQRCWNLTQSLSPGKEFVELKMPRWVQMVSWLAECTLAPFIALSLLRRRSWWGGILYHVRCGKVTRVERPSPNSKIPPLPSSSAADLAVRRRPSLKEPAVTDSVRTSASGSSESGSWDLGASESSGSGAGLQVVSAS